MAPNEETIGGLINRKSVPSMLFGLAVLLTLIGFAVGWFSVDAKLHQWELDEQAEDRAGAEIGTASFDLEMHMLRIEAHATPLFLENEIRERGEPTYDDHAGRMGTVMLGMLLLNFTVLVGLLALTGFYYLHHKGKNNYGPVVKRLAVVFIVLMIVSLLYFALRIGPAARDDEAYILSFYSFSDQVAYRVDPPDLGFWKTWRSDKEVITNPTTGTQQVWQFEVFSRPSAGFWVSLGSLGCVVGARVMSARNGEFEEIEEGPPEAIPPLPTFVRG